MPLTDCFGREAGEERSSSRGGAKRWLAGATACPGHSLHGGSQPTGVREAKDTFPAPSAGGGSCLLALL